MRKSVVMGTVWVFKPTEAFRFDQLCISRMVERFGKDDGNWEHIELDLLVNLSGSNSKKKYKLISFLFYTGTIP